MFKSKTTLKVLNVVGDLGGLDSAVSIAGIVYDDCASNGLSVINRNEFCLSLSLVFLLKETETWGVLMAKAIKCLGFKQQKRLVAAMLLFFRV